MPNKRQKISRTTKYMDFVFDPNGSDEAARGARMYLGNDYVTDDDSTNNSTNKEDSGSDILESFLTVPDNVIVESYSEFDDSIEEKENTEAEESEAEESEADDEADDDFVYEADSEFGYSGDEAQAFNPPVIPEPSVGNYRSKQVKLFSVWKECMPKLVKAYLAFLGRGFEPSMRCRSVGDRIVCPCISNEFKSVNINLFFATGKIN